jgi:NifU-like protein involved in Fe-S cluster formation
MTKVKVLSADWPDVLERMLNEFVSNHEVRDIEFATAGCGSVVIYSAMIIYEED